MHPFLEAAKISYQTPAMLTKALDFHFRYISVCYVCYVMYAKIVTQLHILNLLIRFIKSLLQMNSNSLINKQKQKQTNKQNED